jgi:hypothetical protein
MAEEKTRKEMVGEFCREAAVLTLIFALLDKVLREGQSWFAIVWKTAIILACSAALFLVGVAMEEDKFG